LKELEMTECLVTVCGHPDPSKRNRFSLNGTSYDVDGVISTSSLPKQILQRLLVSGSDCALVILVGATERATANAILHGFCDARLKGPKEAFCRVSLIIGDGVGSDAVQFDCERASDVEALSSENDSAKVLSATITSTVATSETFEFIESRLTLLFCAPESCDELPKLVDTVAHQLRIVPRLVMCHVQAPEEKTLQGCLRFRSPCPIESFGVSENVSLAVRLRDVRSWTVKVNDFFRLTPSAGPNLIHLNPTSCCDKLAHRIATGCTFIVGCSDDANAFDFILSPTGALDSVWSPHCRLRNENSRVFIRPECGLTYVNGVLLAEETELANNDRIAIGTEILLRFAQISQHRDPSLRRIIDWCSKAVEEFSQTCVSDEVVVNHETQTYHNGAFLVLTNPPEHHQQSNVWSLCDFEEGVPIAIGAGLDIAAPVKGKATLLKDDEGYTVSVGSTTKRVHHGSRFLVGESLFLVNDTCRRKHSAEKFVANPEILTVPFSFAPAMLTELRNELFDLQWTVSMLFDFTFPVGSTESGDPHVQRRKLLADDSTLTADRYTPKVLTSTIRDLTESLRLIGSQLSAESFAGEGDVNMSLLRALHERNRTIEQLLLGTDSSAPVAWRQVEALQQSLGDKLNRIAQLESREGPNETGLLLPMKSSTIQNKDSITDTVLSLKALVTIPTPSVARRLASTVESLSRSGNVRQMWDRFCRDVDGLIEGSGGAHNIQPNKQQSVLLAILDVLLAFEAGLKQGWIVQGDKAYVDRRIAVWRIAAEQCCSAFTRPVQSTARRLIPSPLNKSRLTSPISSRQPSPAPTPASRGSSRDRNTRQQQSATIQVRGARTISPLQRVPQSINVSPAAMRSTVANKAPSVPLTARSTVSRSSTRGHSPLVDRNLSSPLQRPVSSTALRPAALGRPASPSPSVSTRPTRVMSPKTLLTKQLLEQEVGNYKRRT
jgi:hypothetical protein